MPRHAQTSECLRWGRTCSACSNTDWAGYRWAARPCVDEVFCLSPTVLKVKKRFRFFEGVYESGLMA